jgi:predicted DNA-binding transcriptional regulator AlpA
MTDLPTVLPASDAARILGLSQSTLAKLRLSGNGPAYCKLGRRVVYQPDDLVEWLAERRRRSTAEMKL